MLQTPKIKPPWGSKERINRAGDAIRDNKITDEDALYLDAWRGSHRYILNTFQAILRNRTRGSGILVAQRLKRRVTIIDKLIREPGMRLARMDDVAGCRLIFPNLRSLAEFRGAFQWANFKHKRRNTLDKYDYIKRPKPLGYRGIHDVYEYETTSKVGARFKGLLLEMQYRTRCQHAWATSVELITHLTGFEPKFNRGDQRHIEFFRLASEIIARTCEGMNSCYPTMRDAEVARSFEDLEANIHVMSMLNRMQPSGKTAADGVLILQIGENQTFTIHEFPDRGAATPAYFKLEKEYPKDDIVLVSGDTFASIRSAYRNYFSDVSEFIKYVEDGCKLLKSQS